jgi:isocitrate lyase
MASLSQTIFSLAYQSQKACIQTMIRNLKLRKQMGGFCMRFIDNLPRSSVGFAHICPFTIKEVPTHLVIVESPAKAKTIKRFLGKDYIVEASMGHVRDLPKSGLGIDVDKNFEPTYEISDGKEAVIKKLRAAMKEADDVWIATDDSSIENKRCRTCEAHCVS